MSTEKAAPRATVEPMTSTPKWRRGMSTMVIRLPVFPQDDEISVSNVLGKRRGFAAFFMSIATCLFGSFSLLPPSCSWGAARRQERRGSRWEKKTMFWGICYICPTTCLRRRRAMGDESISSMWCSSKSIEMRQSKIEQERATTPTRKKNQAMSF